MKTLVNIFTGMGILLALVSCNRDGDRYNNIQNIAKLKIDSVRIPADTMTLGTVQTIRTYSTYTSGCQFFYNYDYQMTNALNRVVTAYSYQDTGYSCNPIKTVGASRINFYPQAKGTYIFKFWNGNVNGTDNYIQKNIVVK